MVLKLVAQTIREVFGSTITAFLKDGELFFRDVRDVLEDHLKRLSALEEEIVYWLAIEREAIVLSDLQGHIDWVRSVAFSPDRNILASGGYDGVINLWDLQTYACLHTLRIDRPYERMNITQVKGLTEATKATLRSLGAIEDERQHQQGFA